MASEIEIVNLTNFEKIQNFLNDSAYKEILENSENFNTKLSIDRRLRMPFLDPQTGVAQTHCKLFMQAKKRMPGFREGQIYTYPSHRWRKPKRQYLLNPNQSYRTYQYRGDPSSYHQSAPTSSRDHHQSENSAILATDGNSMNSGDNDSKDSHVNVEHEWFHDEMSHDISHYRHHDDFEDDFESDNDFDESYSSRGKRKRGATRSRRSNVNMDGTPKRGRRGGNRRRPLGPDGEPLDRRRRGVKAALEAAAAAAAAAAHSNSASPIATNDDTSQSGLIVPQSGGAAPSTATFEKALNPDPSVTVEPATPTTSTVAASTSSNSTSSASVAASPKKDAKNNNKSRSEREIAEPSPYCDFCLGDQKENKKTNMPEELVSCSDCGRSGHPTCLQFTPNMIISVKRYRWQCIECKFCSICGTSDNDDQLLFCDDCDRGYHMYCLDPPLITPPEGSWSCKLCLEEFHKEETTPEAN